MSLTALNRIASYDLPFAALRLPSPPFATPLPRWRDLSGGRSPADTGAQCSQPAAVRPLSTPRKAGPPLGSNGRSHSSHACGSAGTPCRSWAGTDGPATPSPPCGWWSRRDRRSPTEWPFPAPADPERRALRPRPAPPPTATHGRRTRPGRPSPSSGCPLRSPGTRPLGDRGLDQYPWP